MKITIKVIIEGLIPNTTSKRKLKYNYLYFCLNKQRKLVKFGIFCGHKKNISQIYEKTRTFRFLCSLNLKNIKIGKKYRFEQ